MLLDVVVALLDAGVDPCFKLFRPCQGGGGARGEIFLLRLSQFLDKFEEFQSSVAHGGGGLGCNGVAA